MAEAWEDLEVRKRTLTVGTAGILEAPEFEIPPYAEGTAVITWKTGGRTNKPLKDHSLEQSTTIIVQTLKIDPASIAVKPPDPQLPGLESGRNRRKRRGGDTATAGDAVQDAMEAIAAGKEGAEVPPHAFSEPPNLEDDADPACMVCGLAKTSSVHQETPPEPSTPIGKKRATRSGTMKATRRPRARG